MTKKMILDLDTGIDDALALAYALASPEVELIGICATYGNVLMKDGVKNSLALLELLGHSEVSVFEGIDHAQEKNSFEVVPISAFIHGKNGVGEVKLDTPSSKPASQSAVEFIIEAAHTYKDDLLYVPTGPLTNLSAAIKKDPSIIDEMGKVVDMGGALCVPGNVSPWAEANINQDPDAANDVFRSGISCTMIGLDVTLQTLLTKKETQQWLDLGTVAGKVYADMTNYYIKAYETTSPHLGGCGLHDPLAVAVAIDPSLVKTLAINMKVDTEGPTRGRTIGNEQELNNPHKSMQVALQVDTDRFLHEFMERITSFLSKVR